MINEIPLALQTLYAELIDQCAPADFERDFPASGNFVCKERNGRRYWYFQATIDGRQRQKYVGPETPQLLSRIESHRHARTAAKGRREMVQALKQARMPNPDEQAGKLLAALSEAGVFRLRTVLVGTMAYQTYAPLLGVRFSGQMLRTGDIDLAQFRDISILVEDQTPPVIDILKKVDPTFREVPYSMDSRRTAAYRSAGGYRVEFLTPNKGPDTGEPQKLPALGTDAQPLRFLDFLIHNYIPAAILHGEGVLVNVPSPERYALHKLIVARRRREGAAKIDKDIRQAGTLLEVLVAKRRSDLKNVWQELQAKSPKWRQLLAEGLAMLPMNIRGATLDAVGEVLTLRKA